MKVLLMCKDMRVSTKTPSRSMGGKLRNVKGRVIGAREDKQVHR